MNILITGASGAIGRAMRATLEAAGHRVLGTARKPADTQGFLPLDVTDAASVAACVAAAQDRMGQIDVLVNNAGYDLYGGLEETSFDAFLDQIDTNFLGAVRMTKAVLPLMRAQGAGRIVNVSSLGGLVGLPMNSAYAASKFALEGFSESLRLELLPDRIFVSLIEPEAVATDTLDQSIREVAGHVGKISERRRKMVAALRAEGRNSPVSSEDVARVVLTSLSHTTPKLRYPVGRQARLIPRLKALLPQSSFERILTRRFP